MTKKTTPIPTEGLTTTDFDGMTVEITSDGQSPVNGRVMSGHAVLVADRRTFMFFQNMTSRRKNKILARVRHTTFRQTRSGGVRATICYDPSEQKGIKEEILTEIRECFRIMEGKK